MMPVSEQFKATCGQILREYREASGMSQVTIADLGGLTQANVSDIELGRVFHLNTVEQYAIGLDLTLADLLSETINRLTLT